MKSVFTTAFFIHFCCCCFFFSFYSFPFSFSFSFFFVIFYFSFFLPPDPQIYQLCERKSWVFLAQTYDKKDKNWELSEKTETVSLEPCLTNESLLIPPETHTGSHTGQNYKPVRQDTSYRCCLLSHLAVKTVLFGWDTSRGAG